jgi:hypothetical protein
MLKNRGPLVSESSGNSISCGAVGFLYMLGVEVMVELHYVGVELH